MKLIITIFILIFSLNGFSQSETHAITVKLRGTVEVTIDGKTKKLKKGAKVPPGAVLTSKEKSFAVIKMSDDTKLTLGPSSSIEVQEVSAKGKPGLINILKGQLRSKVKPDKVKKGNKLFIKANMAALGVRGTETIITYNPVSKSFTTGGLTGLVVISPISDKKVSVAGLQKKMNEKKNPNLILLPKQYFSSIKMDKGNFKVSKPQKMNTVQYFALRRNPLPNFASNQRQLKNLRPTELPGLLPQNEDIIVVMAISPDLVSGAQGNTSNVIPASVGDNTSTPIAGAIVDFTTGTIINPSPTDSVDPVTGMRTPTTNLGTVSTDGTYQPPAGYKLDDYGVFVVDNSSQNENRSPASSIGVEVASNGSQMTPPQVPNIEEMDLSSLDFNDSEAIENQNAQVNTTSDNTSDSLNEQSTSSSSNSSENTASSNAQVAENSTGLQNDSELGDNVINVENDCPNRKICDSFNSVSPTTTDTITKTAVQFNIIIRK